MRQLLSVFIVLQIYGFGQAQTLDPKFELPISSDFSDLVPYLDQFLTITRDYGPNKDVIGPKGQHSVIRRFDRDGTLLDTIHLTIDGHTIASHITSARVQDSILTLPSNTIINDTFYFGRIEINVISHRVLFDTLWPSSFNPNRTALSTTFGVHSEIHGDTMMVSSSASIPNPDNNEEPVTYAIRSWGDTAEHIIKWRKHTPTAYFGYYDYIPSRDQYLSLGRGYWWLWDKQLNMVTPAYSSYEQDEDPNDPYFLTSLTPTNGKFEIVDQTAFLAFYSATERLGYIQPVLLIEKWDLDGNLITRKDVVVDTFDYPAGFFTSDIAPGTSNNAVQYDGKGHLYILAHKQGGWAGNRTYVVKADTNLNVIWRRLFYTDDLVMAREIVLHPEDPDGVYFTGIRTESQINEDPFDRGQLRIFRITTEGVLSSVGVGPVLRSGELVFPNPASGQLFVTEAYLEHVAKVELYDVIGRAPVTYSAEGGQIDISGLPIGSYVLAAYDIYNQPIAQQRVLIVR